MLLRVLAGLGSIAAGTVAFFAAFVGTVVFTGCFIKCDPSLDDPNVVVGTLIWAGAGALLVAGCAAACWALTGRRKAARVAVVVTAPLVVLAVAAGVVQMLPTVS